MSNGIRDPDRLEQLRRKRTAGGTPEWLGKILPGMERGERLLGLWAGTGASLSPAGLVGRVIPGVKDWLPDFTNIPEAATQFRELSREGDWDAAITSAQDTMDAGTGYWGLSELGAGAVVPTGVPAAIGKGLIRAAPRLAGTLGKLAPAATREATEQGLRTGITGLGKVARAPWEAEEWLGRQALAVPAGIWRGIREPLLGSRAYDTGLADAVDQGVADIADDLVGPSIVDEAEEVVPFGGAPEPLPVGETPYGQQPFGETEFQIRGMRGDPYQAEEILTTPAGIRLAIQRAKTARKDAGIALRRAEAGGTKRRNLQTFQAAYDQENERIVDLERQLRDLTEREQVPDAPILSQAEQQQRSAAIKLDLQKEIAATSGQKRKKAVERLRLVEEAEELRLPKMRIEEEARLAQSQERLAQDIEGQRSTIYDEEYDRLLNEEAAKPDPAIFRPRGPRAKQPILSEKERLAQTQQAKERIKEVQELSPDADILGLKARAGDATDLRLRKQRIQQGLEPDFEIDRNGNIIPKKPVEAPIDPKDRKIQDPRSMDEAVDLSQRDEVGRRIANWPGIKQIIGPLNRAAVAGKVELKGLIGRAMLMSEGQQKAQVAMASLLRLGKFSDLFGAVDQSGFIAMGQGPVANPFAGMSPNDLRTNLRGWLEQGEFTMPLREGQTVQQKGAFALNENQRQWLESASLLEKEKLDFLKRNGIDITPLSFDEGGEYAGRRVYAKFDGTGNLEQSATFNDLGQGRIGAQPSFGKQRQYATQADALDDGLRYLPEEDALALNIQAAYNTVANRRFSDWLIKNIPDFKLEPNAELSFRTFIKGEQQLGFGDEALARSLGPDFSARAFKGPRADEALKALQAQISAPQLNRALGLANQANGVARFFTLAGDISPFLIQLLYMAGTDPVAYGKAMRGFGLAFQDPAFHDKYLAMHADTVNRHQNLITTRNGVEFTEAFDRGGWLRERTEGPGLKGLAARGLNIYSGGLRRFQVGYNAALDVAGIEMAEGLEHLARNADGTIDAVKMADIDDFVNEMRGLSSSAKVGVSPRMRQIETSLLLAPRYNRAIASLLWDTGVGVARTFAPGQGFLGQNQPLRTKLARDGMGKAIAGLSALSVALTTAHYIANTDEDKYNVGEWADSVQEHLTPTSSKFFTWDLFGRNIGPGTKVRSVIQLIAKSAVDPMDLTKGITMENPMVRFLRGSSAPVIGRGVDLLSGYNYVGEPTRNEMGDLRGWAQAVPTVLLPNFVPIWAQAALLEGGTPSERAVGAMAEFAGGRGYPLTRTQMMQQYHQQDPESRDTPWDELPWSTRRQYDKRLTEETGDPGYRGPKGPLKREIDQIEQAHIEAIAEIAENYLSDEPFSPGHSPRYARELIAQAKANKNNELHGPGGKYQELYGTDEREEPEKNTLEHVRWSYYQLYANATNAQGEIDWDEFEPREMEFWATLSEPEARWLLQSIHLTEGEYHPRAKQLAEATRWVSKLKVEVDGTDINYWNINKHPNVIARLEEMVPSLERIKILDYMNAPKALRDDMEEGREAYRILARAKRFLEAAPSKANRYAGGLIHNYKDEFLENAPSGWLNTMVMYGFDFKGRDKILERYRAARDDMGRQEFREIFYLPPYREQYETMMQAIDPSDLMFGPSKVPEEVGAQ